MNNENGNSNDSMSESIENTVSTQTGNRSSSSSNNNASPSGMNVIEHWYDASIVIVSADSSKTIETETELECRFKQREIHPNVNLIAIGAFLSCVRCFY